MNEFKIVHGDSKFVLKKGETVLFEVEDPRQTYSDDSIISAGLTIYAGLYELKEEIKKK